MDETVAALSLCLGDGLTVAALGQHQVAMLVGKGVFQAPGGTQVHLQFHRADLHLPVAAEIDSLLYPLAQLVCLLRRQRLLDLHIQNRVLGVCVLSPR